MNRIKKIFTSVNVMLGKELLQKLEQIAKVETLPKGSILVKEGQIAHRLYFLEKRTARAFYYHNAKDIIYIF